jgi:nitrite reductase/ring-hydroxylating ferredoxin subunit
MPHWHDVGPLADFPAGAGKPVQVGGDKAVIFSASGQLYAVLDCCPHAGMPLVDATCHGTILKCPFHGYAYDLRTGRNIDYPYDEPPLRRLRIRIEDSRVLVEARPKPLASAPHDPPQP